MIIKTKKNKNAILKEGTYPATLISIKGIPSDSDPKSVDFGFKPDGHDEVVTKRLPFSFEDGMPLRKDAETLRGSQLTSTEASEGFDLSTLLNKQCRIVVAHKPGAGGKPKAIVSVIMPAPQTSLPLNA